MPRLGLPPRVGLSRRGAGLAGRPSQRDGFWGSRKKIRDGAVKAPNLITQDRFTRASQPKEAVGLGQAEYGTGFGPARLPKVVLSVANSSSGIYFLCDGQMLVCRSIFLPFYFVLFILCDHQTCTKYAFPY
jgi:hypothetical protein